MIFISAILLGPRGSGKTVALNHLKEQARASGWIVLSLDASTSGVQDRVNEHIAWAQETHESIPDNEDNLIRYRSVTFKLLPLEWQREAVRGVRPKWGLRRQLTVLADHAARHNTAVLLILDEMHSGDPSELRRLAADLQHITKGEHLPLAFLGAGSSVMRHTLLADKRATFFALCNREDMPPLNSVDAARFLAKATSDAGGSFEGDALNMLAEASGSLPYKMQLVGHCAWDASSAPERPIDETAATVAINEAARLMHERVALPAWYTLNDSEQAYLRKLTDLGGTATPQQIAEGMAANPRTLARAWQTLTNAGCVDEGPLGSVQVADVIPVDSIRQIARVEALHTRGNYAGHRRVASPRCNAQMPRAQALCVLPAGHSGGHRSR